MRLVAMTSSVLILLAVGCSDTSGGAGPPEVTVTTTAPGTGEDTGEPLPESTDAESTQPEQNQPSIEIASLPIGGVPDDGANCNPISWLAGEIPDGVTIRLGAPRFDPPGIFGLDESGCPADAQECPGLEWTAQNLPQCWVGFEQLADEGTVSLVIPATATCASTELCDSLRSLGGSQITLTAQPPSG